MNDQKKINYVNITILATFIIAVVVRFFGSLFLPQVVFDNMIFNLLFPTIIFFLPFAVYFICIRSNPFKEISFKKMRISNILLTLLFAFLLRPVLNFFNVLSMVIFKPVLNDIVLTMPLQMPFLVGLLLVAVLPAFFEEAAYRGVTYQTYRKSGTWKAVLLSGLIFGLMHGNMNQFSYAFVLGCVLCLLYEASGSILSTMIVHFWINGGSVVAAYLIPWCYNMIKGLKDFYLAMGMEDLWTMLSESTFGGVERPYEEFLKDLLSQTAVQSATAADVFVALPKAVFAGVLAFLVLRTIAKRSGKYKTLQADFLAPDVTELSGPDSVKVEQSDSKILTVALMLALALGVIAMFVAETLALLPRK